MPGFVPQGAPLSAYSKETRISNTLFVVVALFGSLRCVSAAATSRSPCPRWSERSQPGLCQSPAVQQGMHRRAAALEVCHFCRMYHLHVYHHRPCWAWGLRPSGWRDGAAWLRNSCRGVLSDVISMHIQSAPSSGPQQNPSATARIEACH